MGRPFSLLSIVFWHSCTFLGGYFSGDFLHSQRDQWEVIESVARSASRAAARECADRVEECCPENQQHKRTDRKRPASKGAEFGFGSWILIVVTALGNWLLGTLCSALGWCHRRRQRVIEDESESESPRSIREQRTLAQQQLATLRLRRHGVN